MTLRQTRAGQGGQGDPGDQGDPSDQGFQGDCSDEGDYSDEGEEGGAGDDGDDHDRLRVLAAEDAPMQGERPLCASRGTEGFGVFPRPMRPAVRGPGDGDAAVLVQRQVEVALRAHAAVVLRREPADVERPLALQTNGCDVGQ